MIKSSPAPSSQLSGGGWAGAPGDAPHLSRAALPALIRSRDRHFSGITGAPAAAAAFEGCSPEGLGAGWGLREAAAFKTPLCARERGASAGAHGGLGSSGYAALAEFHLSTPREEQRVSTVGCKGKFGRGGMAEPRPLLCKDGVQATKKLIRKSCDILGSRCCCQVCCFR